MAGKPQDFANHSKMVMGFHGVLTLLAMGYAAWALAGLFDDPSWDSAAFAALGGALLMLGWYARIFANQNQDRIIRLEERLRMRELLPDELHGRIKDFTTGQLIALRFASDGELPALAKKVLDERITDSKAIKRLITDWRPDHQRV